MYSTFLFWLAFGATVVLLVVSLVSGFLRRRRVHLWSGPLTMVALVFAVLETEALMRQYTFPEEALRTHLIFAKAGGLLALPVIVTGLWLLKQPRARLWHRIAIWVWLLAVLAATGTGLWIFGLAEAKAG